MASRVVLSSLSPASLAGLLKVQTGIVDSRREETTFTKTDINSGTRTDIMSEAVYVNNIPGYPAPHSPYSHAVVANGFVFVSGQIAVRPDGGPTEIVGTMIQEQTRQSLKNVKVILEAAGSSMERIVKVTVLLAQPDLFKGMNEAYAEFFPVAKPARAIVRFGADVPGVLVSVEVVALAGKS
jgi:2-iminobutanoate/2-iminopropanoate deaminase